MVNKGQLGIWKKIVFYCCELCSGNSVELWNKDVDKDDIMVEEGGEGWNKDLDKDIMVEEGGEGWNKDLDKDIMVDKDIMEEKDIISGLPEDILVSIISLTHSKAAVRTSSLSKRWRNLYKLLPSVCFSCYNHAKHQRNSRIFADQMLRFLQLHSGDITYFYSNSCLTPPDAPIFERSIQILGNLGVKSVSLNFYYSIPTPSEDPFSYNLFSFSSHLLSYMPCLQYCSLTACNLLPTLKTSCTSLQELGLSYVKLLPGSVDCILSNCLRLRSLHLVACKFDFEKMDIRGDNLRLEHLWLDDPNGLKKIEFYASNLKTFEYSTLNNSAELIFDYVPQLQNVELETPDAYFAKKAMFYLYGLPHLKALILDTPGYSYQVPNNMFWNLTRLDLRLQHNKVTILFSVIQLLHRCPVLQEFILETLFMIPSGGSMQVVPHGRHEHLRSVDINGFYGTKAEVEFVAHILKSATRLEEMIISHYDWSEYELKKLPKNMEKLENIVRQLKRYATVSQTQLIFRGSPRESYMMFDRPKVEFGAMLHMYAPD